MLKKQCYYNINNRLDGIITECKCCKMDLDYTSEGNFMNKECA